MAVSPGSVLAPLGFFIASPGQLGPPSPLLADNIDPVTKDFRDLFTGVDPIDDQVQVVATTTRGSGGAVLDIGLGKPPSKILDNTKARLEGDMRRAFAHLIRNRDIDFKRISFGTDDGTGSPSGSVGEHQTVQINLEFRNLRALDPKVRSLPLTSVPNSVVG